MGEGGNLFYYYVFEEVIFFVVMIRVESYLTIFSVKKEQQ